MALFLRKLIGAALLTVALTTPPWIHAQDNGSSPVGAADPGAGEMAALTQMSQTLESSINDMTARMQKWVSDSKNSRGKLSAEKRSELDANFSALQAATQSMVDLTASNGFFIQALDNTISEATLRKDWLERTMPDGPNKTDLVKGYADDADKLLASRDEVLELSADTRDYLQTVKDREDVITEYIRRGQLEKITGEVESFMQGLTELNARLKTLSESAPRNAGLSTN